MKLRIITNENYIDVCPADGIDVHELMRALDEGNTIAIDTIEGDIFVLNAMNAIGIFIIKEKEIPPITQ